VARNVTGTDDRLLFDRSLHIKERKELDTNSEANCVSGGNMAALEAKAASFRAFPDRSLQSARSINEKQTVM
jgi:hypothetical protein